MAVEKYLPKTPELRRWRLAEEIGEVITEGAAVLKEMSKFERFGPNGDPDFQAYCREHGTPRERLLKELDDLAGAIAAVRADTALDYGGLRVSMRKGRAMELRSGGGKLRVELGNMQRLLGLQMILCQATFELKYD